MAGHFDEERGPLRQGLTEFYTQELARSSIKVTGPNKPAETRSTNRLKRVLINMVNTGPMMGCGSSKRGVLFVRLMEKMSI